jgi:hemolysin III
MIQDPHLQAEDWFNQSLSDGGPLYTETNPDQIIVEPWNAVSSLFIVIPAIIWLIRIRKDYRNYAFMIYCIPLMILGGTGNTIFHAFRVSKFFLIMDVLPTALLSLSMGIYFWLKLLKNRWIVLILLFLSIASRFLFFRNLPPHVAINVSYAISGVFIGLPLILILFKTSWSNLRLVAVTIAIFTVALIFRETDTYPIPFLPMGTHFLWHVFSGVGAYFILAYLYSYRKNELLIKAD